MNEKKYFAELWASAWGLKQDKEYLITWKESTNVMKYKGISESGAVKFTGRHGPITLPLVIDGGGWSMKAIRRG